MCAQVRCRGSDPDRPHALLAFPQERLGSITGRTDLREQVAYVHDDRYLIDDPPYGRHREHHPTHGHRQEELPLRRQ